MCWVRKFVKRWSGTSVVQYRINWPEITIIIIIIINKVIERNMYLMVYIFREVALHRSFYYQLLHKDYFYCYMFRLPVVAIIRESLFTDMRSVLYVKEL
jgi:hypothetical protein